MPLLGSYRVLDLTDEKGYVCGKILGHLGADVIKIEKPGGDTSRNQGPFYKNILHPERSLYWYSLNTNKRSITLDIETTDGREIFKRLVVAADFVLESYPPGYLDQLGLGYDKLSKINPRVIMCSITSFGESGPYRDYKASDIVLLAMGGFIYLCGDPDRPPVRVGVPQAYFVAGLQAAEAVLIAHCHRQATGEGQRVEVSTQECIASIMAPPRQFWDLNKIITQRHGKARPYGDRTIQIVYPCKDGYITLMGVLAREWKSMLEWLESEGMVQDLKEEKWKDFARDRAVSGVGPRPDQAVLDHLDKVLTDFFLQHTKAELLEEAQKRRIMLFPVNSFEDLLRCPQLKSRRFFIEVEYPGLGASINHTGCPWSRSNEEAEVIRRAPFCGEHNQDIYIKEIGFSKEQLTALKSAGVI